MDLTKQDLECIARSFQRSMFSANYEQFSNTSPECVLCRHREQCYILKNGEITRYRHNFNRLLKKLESLTGVYLGYGEDTTKSQAT